MNALKMKAKVETKGETTTMTRAKTELAFALIGALTLVILMAWYQGQRNPAGNQAEPVTGTIVRTEPDATPAPAANTLAVGALAGTVQAPPAPDVPPAELERDRAFISEAFPALSSWEVEEVKPLLSTAALNASTDRELAEVMATLSDRLGTLQYFDSPQPANGPDAFASTDTELQPYVFTAYYEAGEAEVNLVLEKEQQRSSLYSFDIHVPN
jgi:hypothetical protein